MTALKPGPRGEIVLPENMRPRIAEGMAVRVIEIRHGILLVPLTKEPMSPALAQELAQWQSLASSSWEMFDYQDETSFN
jgi:hypothetical protein